MPHVFFALIRSFAGLARPDLWKYLVIPPLIGGAVWLVSAFLWLGILTDWLVEETPLSWLHRLLGDWHLGWIATILAFVGAWVVLLSGAYLVAIMVSGIWALPGIARSVAASDYPDLLPRGTDSLLLSVGVTLKAMLLYLIGWTLTLPVWLVPGMAIVHSFFWLAYLNRATFAYDALAAHASADEWKRLSQDHGGRTWLLGLMAAFLAHVPLIGFFAPSMAAMAFVHYGMEALRGQRKSASNAPTGNVAAETIIDGEFRRE